MAGNDKFRTDIKRFISKSNNKINQFARAVVLGVDSSIVLKSPVDSGRFRNNWFIGDGSINANTTLETDPSGTGAITRANRELQSININGQIIYVTNSLPYAYRLEYEGWSQKAPMGFVRITLAELSGILKQAAFEVKQ